MHFTGIYNNVKLFSVMYRQGVVAIIQNKEGKFLLARRRDDPTHLQFPQGGIHDGETEEEALLREILEEVGITDISIMAKTKIKPKYKWPEENIAKKTPEYTRYGFIGQEHRYFLCRCEQEMIQVDKKEFIDYLWVTKDEVLRKAARVRRKNYLKALQDLKIID